MRKAKTKFAKYVAKQRQMTKKFAHVAGKTITFMEWFSDPKNEEPAQIYLRFTDNTDLVIRLMAGIEAEWARHKSGNTTPMPRRKIFEKLADPEKTHSEIK